MALTLLATNNAESTLASAISATDTSLIVSAGTGAEFPDAVAGESYFKLTLTDAATGSQVEIVNVTAKAGDIFTIERAQEGTLARAWAANDMVANMMTADTLNIIAQYAQQAAASAEQAGEYAGDASDYARNKFTFYKTASDPDGTIAGLAATTDGQSFWVAQGPDALSAAWQYQNAAGVAVLQAKQPGTAAVTGTIREFPSLSAAQADADAGNIPVGTNAYYRTANDDTLAIEVVNVDGTLQPTGRRLIRDDYGFQVSPDSVALAGYDPETKRVAPFLNTDGRLIQIGPDGKYYELLTPQEAELYALGSEGQVTQFIGGEKVWRMIVDAATNQIVEAYTVGGHHWIYSDSGLVLVNQESGGGGDDDTTILPEYGLHLSGSTVYPYSETVPVCFIFVTAGQSNARGYCPDADQTIVAATPVYPDNAFMLSGGVRRTGTRSTTLVPLVEAVSGTDKETAASGLANTFIRDMAAATGIMPRTLSIVCAQSGRAYEYQKRGNQVYQYLLDSIEDCVTACKARGWLPIVLCIDWMQGESDEDWSGLREGMYES
ncbi:TPA: sialate O-acetylesterase, partial [Klebsiella pneumoniae]